MAKIRIVKDAAGNTCKCGSWLKHWENISGNAVPKFCTVNSPDCIKTDIVAAHVQKTGTGDNKIYVIPLCSEHSQSNEEIVVSDIYPMIPADTKLCRKR